MVNPTANSFIKPEYIDPQLEEIEIEYERSHDRHQGLLEEHNAKIIDTKTKTEEIVQKALKASSRAR